MSPMILVLSLLMTAPDDPADLAARVVSGEPAAREEAAGALEEIGRAALPALRVAAGGTNDDPAASRRVGEIIDRIERRRLLRATPIDFEAKDLPVAEAVAEFGKKAGVRLVLDPSAASTWASKRITIAGSNPPLGFWEGLDRLGESGGFRPDPTGYWTTGPATTEPVVRLAKAEGPAPRTSYAGPYRVDLLGLDRHRRTTQARPGAAARVDDEFVAVLQIVPEPGLEIDRNGSPRVDEAVDDKGADLRPESTAETNPQRANMFRQWRPEAAGALTFRVPLAIPKALGGTLKQFRGDLPITALARTGPLMVFKLEGSEARPLSAGGVTLVVERVDRVNGRISAFQALVRGAAINQAPSVAPGPRQLTLGRLEPAYHADDHFQIVDDKGNLHQIYSNVMGHRPDGSFQVRINLASYGYLGPATTVRYHGIVGEAVEVPFSFDDVPLP